MPKLDLYILLIIFTVLINGQEMRVIDPATGSAEVIVIHPKYPNIVYASNYVLFKSNNYGNSALPIELNTGFSTITNITLNTQDTNSIFVNIFDKSLKTKNGGKDWELIYEHIGGLKNVYEFNPLNTDIIFMTRDEKEIWRSDNQGEDWYLVKQFEEELRDVKIAPSDTSIIYCAAEMGIYKSETSGTKWSKNSGAKYYGTTRQITINPNNSSSIFFLSNNILYKSLDGGVNASKIFEDGLNEYKVSPKDTLTIYLKADLFKYYDNNLIKTTDGGNSWSIIKNKIPDRDFTVRSFAIDPINTNNLYASINFLGIYKSEDGGLNWHKTNMAFSAPYFIYPDVIKKGQTIYTNSGSWGLLKTTNNGENWYQPEFDFYPDSVDAYGISFNPQNPEEGFISGLYYLFKTENGGESWNKTGSRRNNSTISYHPLNSRIMFLGYRSTFDVFADAIIARSEDGGETWQDVKNLGGNSAIRDFIFHPLDSNIVFTYSTKMILKSVDKGLTWSVKNNGINTQYNNFSGLVIDYLNPDILYCSQGRIDSKIGFLFKSTNGCDSWERIDSAFVEQFGYPSVSCLQYSNNSSSRLYIGVPTSGEPFSDNFTNGGLYVTENDGKSFYQIFDGMVNSITIDNSNPRNIYFGSKFGIMTFVDTFKVTSVNDIEFITIPNNFILYQNYPNPFNPSTKIKFSTSKKIFVELIVFDALGRKITTIVNEEKQPGYYEVVFNANNLPSGIYYYKLSAGKYIEVKKMLLLK